MNHQRYVAYFRVSTQKQGKSGLGLEAQQRAVRDYLAMYGGEVIAEFQEVESGKRTDRPEFNRACDYAELSNASLLVAKLDRLSRDLNFVTGLQKRGIRFKLCDMPDVDQLTVHILASMAQHEASMISARTKAAMAEAKARGIVLGNPYLDVQRNRDVTAANSVRSESQAEWKRKILKVISHLESEGYSTCQQLADELNHRGLKTQRGSRFSVPIVSRLRRQKC